MILLIKSGTLVTNTPQAVVPESQLCMIGYCDTACMLVNTDNQYAITPTGGQFII
jgi:hypothetical protein